MHGHEAEDKVGEGAFAGTVFAEIAPALEEAGAVRSGLNVELRKVQAEVAQLMQSGFTLAEKCSLNERMLVERERNAETLSGQLQAAQTELRVAACAQAAGEQVSKQALQHARCEATGLRAELQKVKESSSAAVATAADAHSRELQLQTGRVKAQASAFKEREAQGTALASVKKVDEEWRALVVEHEAALSEAAVVLGAPETSHTADVLRWEQQRVASFQTTTVERSSVRESQAIQLAPEAQPEVAQSRAELKEVCPCGLTLHICPTHYHQTLLRIKLYC